MDDEGVRATNVDSTQAKVSCVELGYYNDPFVSKFLPRFQRKRLAPLIHRGYYLRVRAVRTLLTHFVESCRKDGLKPQILSVGAGFDTNYWVMEKEGTAPDVFVEVDLPEVVVKKASILQRNAELREAAGIESPIRSPTNVRAPHYVLRAVDIRNSELLEKAIEDVIDTSSPVLVLAECVFAYMKSEETESIMRLFSSKMENAYLVMYEPYLISDDFGRMMLENLKMRGCPLLGTEKCNSLKAHDERLKSCGWKHVSVHDMLQVDHCFIDKEEAKRLMGIEIMDEFEEYRMILQHYALIIAAKYEKCFNLENSIFREDK
eukprot:TRINITY_DN14496_c0_g1_i1.p1 TRINITY_DN14496_c0_g1~~TRINITY_DN14496_c0_g1_i1.p1  ORF type:complete len:319 (+),score=76.93 TRINITY_DN14496_c0_g1_i1:54-1010(+)